MYKIVGVDGQQYGPVSAEEIRRWIADKRVNAQTLAQAEGSPEWKPLGSFSEFASELKAVPPPIAPPPSAIASRASNKIPAGICGILLGATRHSQIHPRLHRRRPDHVAGDDHPLLTCGIAGRGDAHHRPHRRHHLSVQVRRGVCANLRGRTQGMVLIFAGVICQTVAGKRW